MAVTTVAQFALQLNRPTAALLEQLQSAGVAKQSPDDALTEADKERLLEFLRSSHGTTAGAERKKITITRKSTTEIKQADASGKARTIQVEVRKKRTFVKRDDAAPDSGGPSAEDLDLQRREEEAQAQAEAIRVQEAELAEQRRQREEAERAAREAAEAAAAAAAEAAAK
ncbi:MAG: translation initiation factor IF-2 associated domain-containing protein, partial [Burkholderiales bacterium]|nr:translation initiation factor IF-2 associated domain-containing protein [Burkholderiales bacterium]